MNSTFLELNLYVYHSMVGGLYSVVIWCLGPIVDDSRRYGRVRVLLAAITCSICRRVLRA